MSSATAAVMKSTVASTRTLASITVERWGMAANVARMDPVEYSALTTMTPRTPMASDPMVTPARLAVSGSKPKTSSGCLPHWLTVTAQNSAENPTMMIVKMPRHHSELRTVRNFIHSALMASRRE